MTNLLNRENPIHWTLALLVLFAALMPACRSDLLVLELPVSRNSPRFEPDPQSDFVIDATGTPVTCHRYQRIVVLDGVDHVLQLIPADRIAGVGAWAASHSLEGWRLAGKPRFSDVGQVEKILSCHPDLVVLCSVGNPELREAITGLRSLGVPVFDLRYTITLDDLLGQITSLGALLKDSTRAAHLRDTAAQRAALLGLPLRSGRSPARSIFICSWGERVSVGGAGDIFHGMITGSGLRDAGAEAGLYMSPVVPIETALRINPQVLVTRPANRRALASLPGIDAIMQGGNTSVAYIPEPFLGAAAPLDLIDTMEALQDQVYNSRAQKLQLPAHDR